LQELPSKTLRECKAVHFLQPEPSDETEHDGRLLDRGEVLDGLHAKLFVVDHGWGASVCSGSFNATSHALEHNVEFTVELVGKKSRFGVTQFLRSVKGETNLSDLLQKYDPDIVSPAPDPAVRQLDELCRINPDHLTDRVRRVMRAAGFFNPKDNEAESPSRGAVQQEREHGLRKASLRDFHSLRVTWVTVALTAGVPLEIVQKVTGHRTTAIVLKHYFQPGREEFRRTLAGRLPALLGDRTAPASGSLQYRRTSGKTRRHGGIHLAAHPGRTPRSPAGQKERYASRLAQARLRGLIEMMHLDQIRL
jgi:hypothetical protein